MDLAQTIGDMMRILRRRWLVLVLVSGLGIVATLLFALSRPAEYESTAKILIEGQQISDELARSTVNLSATARLQLIQQRLMARDSLLEMIDRLGLFVDAKGLSATQKADLLRNATTIQSISAGETGGWTGTATDRLLAFTITVRLGDPRQATAAVNAFVDAAIAQNLQVRAQRARETLDYFVGESDRMGKVLADLEARITDFKKANEDALPEGQQARREALGRLDSNALEVDRQIMDLEGKRGEIEAAMAGERSATGPGLSPEETELRRLELELAQRRRTLAPGNPALKALESQVAAVRTVVNPGAGATDSSPENDRRQAALHRQADQIDGQISQLRAQKRQIGTERLRLEAAIARTPEVEVALDALERQHKDLQEQYTDVARRRAEARTGEQLEANNQSERFQILEKALVPEYPVGSSRKKIAAAGGLASVGLAAGLVVLLEMLNSGLRTSAQTERELGIRPVVAIPYVSVPGERRRRTAMVVLTVALLLLAGYLAVPLVERYAGTLNDNRDTRLEPAEPAASTRHS